MTDRPADRPDDEAVDEAVLERLRNVAARVDPVPAELTLAARSALAYRDLDIELARLVEASDDKQLAGVRSADTGVLLTFEIESGVIELEVTSERDRVHVVGQCIPAGAEAVEAVQLDREPVRFEVDDLGRFQGDVGRGPLRLVLSWADRQVSTEWVVV